MAASSRQKRVEGRMTHVFKQGALKSGPSGDSCPVKSRKQAIAVALSEAGASRHKSAKPERKALSRTKTKKARG